MWKIHFLLLLVLVTFKGDAKKSEEFKLQFTKDTKSCNQFLFPYYNAEDDPNGVGDFLSEITESTLQIEKDLPFNLPFFGFRYNYIRVSLNGYLEFSDAAKKAPTYPLVFPNKNYPNDNDQSFIGIFYTKARLGTIDSQDKYPSGVYYRVEANLHERYDIESLLLHQCAQTIVRNGIVGAGSFNPKHVITVTWKNISFDGGLSHSRSITNTFQAVLITDEITSYAVFNYDKMNWTSHTEAGGDPTTGLGGVPAFIGFNAGNFTGSYEYLPFSQTSLIPKVLSTGFTNGFLGRHIFRIDEQIVTGSCNKNIDGANLPLVASPESGNMLGGTIVNVTGPCFQPDDLVYCVFGQADPVPAYVIDTNRAYCSQPMLNVEGYITLGIKINNGALKWRTKYYVENPARASEDIFFPDNSPYQKSPSEIKAFWNTSFIKDANANLHLSLWGYRELNEATQFLHIADLAENVMNTGQYNIIPSVHKVDEGLDDIKFGFLQINATTKLAASAMTQLIWSRPVPLGWFFGPELEKKFGPDWPMQICSHFRIEDSALANFTDELPKCPCTLEQALADKGRYLPDPECDKDSNPSCYFNIGAVHCVTTAQTPNGGEQQCCYDKNNYLMLSQDQMYGSSPRRCSNIRTNSNEPTHEPTLSQWWHDISPRFECCLWQNKSSTDCESFRNDFRPTQDCKGYEGPGVAGVYGDPHIVTFDGLEYTFNGKGEFVLVRSIDPNNKFDIQGRFEEMPNNKYGEALATQLTSIVARGPSNVIVEVSLRPKEAQWRYRLNVLVNAQTIYFDRLRQYNYQGVTVYTPSDIYNQSTVIIMFESGAGLEVFETNGYLNAKVYLPREQFFNKIRGLLGNWTLDVLDDLVLPDGEIIKLPVPVSSHLEQIHMDFGLTWMLSDMDDALKGRALFKRSYGRSSGFYNDQSFKPVFTMDINELIPEDNSEERDKAVAYCGHNLECLYDYAMTYEEISAESSLNTKFDILNAQNVANTKIVTCGVLETPRFGRKSTFLFVPGTKVTFECFEGYELSGDSTRECLEEGEWNTPVIGITECLPSNKTLVNLEKVFFKNSFFKMHDLKIDVSKFTEMFKRTKKEN